MTAITFRWSELIGVPAVGSVTVTRRSYRLEPETVFVPFSRTFTVRGEAVQELDPSLPGQGYELTWKAAGTTETLEQVIIVPPPSPGGEEVLAHRLAVDPATLEPLGEEHALTAADLVARAEALTARIESGEFTGAAGVGVESVTDEDADGVATVRLTSGEVSDLPLPRGPQGERGPQGDRGLQGERGERGLTGERGIQGDRGDVGPAPEVSWTGDRLTVGGQTGPSLTGPAGPAGADSTVPGPAGPAGPVGPGVIAGRGAPSGDAQVGTVYLDGETGDVYRFA